MKKKQILISETASFLGGQLTIANKKFKTTHIYLDLDGRGWMPAIHPVGASPLNPVIETEISLIDPQCGEIPLMKAEFKSGLYGEFIAIESKSNGNNGYDPTRVYLYQHSTNSWVEHPRGEEVLSQNN